MVKEYSISGKVVLGVTGSIAAFKAAALSSLLVQRGYSVRVVLTEGASRFVAPLTFEAITSNPVSVRLWDEGPRGTGIGHIELARWAELLVVAPATANSLASLALGTAFDVLGAVALSCRAPVIVAPAMETGMYLHPATQNHIETLRERGVTILGPESGRLASGSSGPGRMVEPERLLEAIERAFRLNSDLAGRTVVVTAGPTLEPIDPVRYIGNRSSGKMGYALAEAAQRRGAAVHLLTGPTALPCPEGLNVVRFERVDELRDALLRVVPGADVVIMAAAVADFRPARLSRTKIKRKGPMSLDLVPTPDLAVEVAQVAPLAVKVGFALETENLITGARDKLRRKDQQLVVGNLLSRDHNPFGAESNRVVLVTEDESEELPEAPKRVVADQILDRIVRLLGT